MKQYLAVLVIALMAVSVIGAAGVVTTSKAAAEDGWPPAKTIAYVSGKTYTFRPAQFNIHSASTSPYDWIGTPTHREFSNGAKVLSSIQTTADEAGQVASTNGVLLKLAGVDPTTDLDKPCTVTLKVGYSLSAVGDANTVAGIALEGPFYGGPTPYVDEIHGDDAVTTKTVDTQTYTFTGTLGDVFGPNLDHGPIFVDVVASQWYVPGAGAATAQAQISSITVTFN